MAWQDRGISQTPEVALAAGKLGPADTTTDPALVEMIETKIVMPVIFAWLRERELKGQQPAPHVVSSDSN